MSDPDCSQCVSDYTDLVTSYNAVCWSAISCTIIVIIILKACTDCDAQSKGAWIGLIGILKIVLGVVALTALMPDCDHVSSCEDGGTCQQACSDVGDPVVVYPYIAIVLGVLWVMRAFVLCQQQPTGSAAINGETGPLLKQWM
eukprot:m.411088 g.411088  ORF g.411088 m.411088 type:complete len:143 (-) comp28571_c0_seq1:131-559(-)